MYRKFIFCQNEGCPIKVSYIWLLCCFIYLFMLCYAVIKLDRVQSIPRPIKSWLGPWKYSHSSQYGYWRFGYVICKVSFWARQKKLGYWNCSWARQKRLGYWNCHFKKFSLYLQKKMPGFVPKIYMMNVWWNSKVRVLHTTCNQVLQENISRRNKTALGPIQKYKCILHNNISK